MRARRWKSTTNAMRSSSSKASHSSGSGATRGSYVVSGAAKSGSPGNTSLRLDNTSLNLEPRSDPRSRLRLRKRVDLAEAALLEFLAAAARTRIVPADGLVGIDGGAFARAPQHAPVRDAFAGLPSTLFLLEVLFRIIFGIRIAPCRKLLHRVAEQLEFPLAVPVRRRVAVHSPAQLVFEFLEVHRFDEPTLERLLHHGRKLDEAEQGDRILPALPEKGLP